MSNDPYLWLEQVDDEQALAWVEARNQQTVDRYAGTARFKDFQNRFRTILDSDDRIPQFIAYGDMLYNFWQDAQHPRGVWRRTTLGEYQSDNTSWELLLDLDELAKQEDENWVYGGHVMLHPNNDRTLINLSRGGGDAIEIREFDLISKQFVDGGFFLPEAKSKVVWGGPDTLLVGTDFGPHSLTDSGYPMTVRVWERGTDLAQATEIYRGAASDVFVFSITDSSNDYEEYYIWRALDFFTSDFYVYRDGHLDKVNKPISSEAFVHRGKLFLRLKKDWKLRDHDYKAGSILTGDLRANLGESQDLEILFEPTSTRTLESWSVTKSNVLLNISENVLTRGYVATPRDGVWETRRVSQTTEVLNESVSPYDSKTSDQYLVHSQSFLVPPTLSLGSPAESLVVLKQSPSFFPNENFSTTQYWTESKDGTRIPYYEIRPKNARGQQPTILYGYGGFEISLLPQYAPNTGVGWLEQGGTYVIANIRGGGEFGPRWHHSALRENRQRAYDDFIAVAEDLIARNVTQRSKLAIQGGSNGGLLMGNMYTQRPDLFGAVVCQVPLLDMQRYHLLLAGASWMAEYGDPDNPEDWEFLQKYSPYQKVNRETTYPPMLMTTSTRDDRVHPGHARKMTARLEEFGHRIDYYENTAGGHAGAADNSQRAFMLALVYEFVWEHLS